MTNLEIVENLSVLRELASDWETLNKSSPMQSPDWMIAWWQHFRTPQDQLCVAVVRDASNSVVGIAPWFRRSSVAMGRTIHFLGSDRACSDFQTLLCQPEEESAVISAITNWLSNCTNPKWRWDLLDFDGVAANDSVMNQFFDRMSDMGHITHRRSNLNTWRLSLDGGWKGFLERQSKSQRNQSRNFANRFDKSSDLAFRFASQAADGGCSCIDALIQLHQMRWEASGMEGCFSDHRMNQFFGASMATMIAKGTADIAIIQRDQRPIAAVTWLFMGNVIFCYQSGRDPSEDANRIGRIATTVGIRWAAENGFTAMDYLRGDEEYKSQMRAVPTPCQRVRVVARAGTSQLRHNLWLACREMKSQFQRLTSGKPTAKSMKEIENEEPAGSI